MVNEQHIWFTGPPVPPVIGENGFIKCISRLGGELEIRINKSTGKIDCCLTKYQFKICKNRNLRLSFDSAFLIYKFNRKPKLVFYSILYFVSYINRLLIIIIYTGHIKETLINRKFFHDWKIQQEPPPPSSWIAANTQCYLSYIRFYVFNSLDYFPKKKSTIKLIWKIIQFIKIFTYIPTDTIYWFH